jgi:hypothetical protein
MRATFERVVACGYPRPLGGLVMPIAAQTTAVIAIIRAIVTLSPVVGPAWGGLTLSLGDVLWIGESGGCIRTAPDRNLNARNYSGMCRFQWCCRTPSPSSITNPAVVR